MAGLVGVPAAMESVWDVAVGGVSVGVPGTRSPHEIAIVDSRRPIAQASLKGGDDRTNVGCCTYTTVLLRVLPENRDL